MRKNTVGLSKKRKISDKEVFAIVIVAAFIISLVVYFTNSYITTERESVVYSKMAEPTLPVVFAVVRDDEGNTREINPMHGHYQDVKNQDVEYITPLPSSRKLEIHIKTYGRTIAGISYDIRNQKLDHYIEKTELENFDNSGDDIYATLPIQNLIDKNEKYILRIRLDIGEEVVYYYSRIYWTDSTDLIKMIDLAKGFAGKTFDEEASRELTVYMETDPHADNENYGTVTIGSSFNALTWGETGMHMATAPEVYLKECEGAMAAFEVSYLTRISDNAGTEEFYNVEEFNLRSGAERIYMMDYRRKTYEIFDGSKHRFSGKKIMLGINNREDLLTMESANGRYIVYKTNRDLWCYDQDAKDAIDIFSFRSKIDDGLRASFREHDIKILSVCVNGDVVFVFY
ncbi:MAG: hypothetical protein Q4B67_03995 [Eubacteriales bacterium]|nr:hypothetical protein [Eubacteriales bacterium]